MRYDSVQTRSDELTALANSLERELGRQTPSQWSETASGTKTRLLTDEKVVALTLDACGQGGLSNGYDRALIQFLREQGIPATLFISGMWIDANGGVFRDLADDPLFDIENHGLRHKPCSVNGMSAWGVKGTRSIAELIEEVEIGARKIEAITGRKPRNYRSGTAYYDEVAVEVVRRLGYQAISFSVLGDKGATYSKSQVKEAVTRAEPGSIVICHMNHPEGDTAAGLIEAIPDLLRSGYRFAKLSEFELA